MRLPRPMMMMILVSLNAVEGGDRLGEDDSDPSGGIGHVSEVGLGMALPTRLASNSTNTALGFMSRTSCAAASALLEEMCAVPKR